jgi:hypothetical protein
VEAGNFSLHHSVQNGSGAHPPSFLSNGYRLLSLKVKQPDREVDSSPPSNDEVKNAWSYISTLRYVFMAWRLVKHRDNFTFTFLFDESGRNSAITPAVNWLK